jgi:hypothetical protein
MLIQILENFQLFYIFGSRGAWIIFRRPGQAPLVPCVAQQ